MKRLLLGLGILLSLTSILLSGCKPKTEVKEVKGPAVMAYIEGGSAFDVNKVAADKLTHVYYSFANVQEGKAVLANAANDVENIKALNALKESNPDLKVLLSVACRDWSKSFSGGAAIDAKSFAQSVANLVKENGLDGIDINWAYPAAKNLKDKVSYDNNSQNYINVIKSVKEALTGLEEGGDKKYILSSTIEPSFSDAAGIELESVQDALDFVILNAIGYQHDKVAIHQANLNAPEKYKSEKSTSAAIQALSKIAPEKLILGVSFEGVFYKMKKNSKTGMGDPYTERLESKGYTYIKDSLVNKNEYYRYWDGAAQVPYVYNFYTSTLVTYDDEESMKAKCEYVKTNNLGGIMINGYNGDPKKFLLNTISQGLK